MRMRLPMDVEQISMAIANGAFYLIILALIVTWIVQLFLRPQTRMEWAEFGKITAFLAIVLRTAFTFWTGRGLPSEVAVVFWTVCFFLVLFYLVAILDDWGPPFVRAFCEFCVDRRKWLVPAAVLLVLAAVIYVLFFAS